MANDMNEELLSALDSFDNIRVGNKVSGEVLKVDDKEAIIGIDNSGFEGVLTTREFSNDPTVDLEKELKRGQKLELVVIKRLNPNNENGSFLLSKKRIDAEKVWDELAIDFKEKKRFEVTVSSTTKNGLLVNLKGLRGFIPASLISTSFVKELQPYVGKTLVVEISELDKEKNRLVLNHRIVEQEANDKAKEEVYSRLLPGDIIEGAVKRLTNFGAFVDVDGVDGLVHISEISYEHVDNPAQVLKVGQLVKAKVLNVDKDTDKLGLSIKALEKSPWQKASETLSVGMIVDGVVKKLTDFGAFVEVQPNIEGLVHISEISWNHIKVPADVLSVGENVTVKIINLDVENKCLGLSIKQLQENPNKEDSLQEVTDFEMPEESHGFNLADVIKNTEDK